jgi:uncharacterized cupin superfamily protein
MGFPVAADQFHTGHWASKICEFSANFTENEMCVLIEGEVNLTDTNGIVSQYKKGAFFVIPAGFVGPLESVQPVVKISANFEPAQR